MTAENVEVQDEFTVLNGFKTFETIGDFVAGTYLGYSQIELENEGRTQVVNQYSIFDEDAGLIVINGTIQMRILASIPVGTNVRVTFQGEIKSGTRRVRNFAVAVDKSAAKAMIAQLVAAGGIKPAEILREHDVIAELAPPTLNPDGTEYDPFADKV